MADLNWPDPSESPWTDPNGVVWEHNGIGWRKKSVSSVEHADTLNRDAIDSHPAAAISGLSLPNMLFNADFLISDHGGGNRTPGINVYGFDRWRGSAIGLKQTVEGESITSGNYTLSWGGGTGNGSLNGVAAASPITTVLAADVNVDAEVPSDATWARLEIGDNQSPHVRREIGEDITKCHRFYWASKGQHTFNARHNSTTNLARIFILRYPVEMRIIPTIISSTVIGLTDSGTFDPQIDSCRIFGNASNATINTYAQLEVLDAEIYD